MRDLFHDMQDMKSRAAAIGRHLAATIRGPVLWLTLCGGLLVAAIFARHHHDGRRIPRARAGQQRARTGKHRAAAHPSLRSAVRGLQHHRRRCDRPAADFRLRLREGISGSASSSAEAHEILRSKAGVLSYLGDISIFDSNGDIINWSRPLPTPALNISERAYFKTFKFEPRSPSVLTEAVRSLLTGNLNTVIAHRLTRRRRCLPRRDDAAHQSRQLREILCVRRARDGRRHFDVSCRRHPAGALSAASMQLIGQKFASRRRCCSVSWTRAASRRCACKARSTRRTGSDPRPRSAALPGHRRRDQHDCRRAGRLARANQVPGQRGNAVGIGDRADPVPDHPPDHPAEPRSAAGGWKRNGTGSTPRSTT